MLAFSHRFYLEQLIWLEFWLIVFNNYLTGTSNGEYIRIECIKKYIEFLLPKVAG